MAETEDGINYILRIMIIQADYSRVRINFKTQNLTSLMRVFHTSSLLITEVSVELLLSWNRKTSND